MARPRRGRLTVYLGAAPGVGKTYAMLGEARRRCDRGTDVVVGYVETHGREPTPRRSSRGWRWSRARSSTTAARTFTEMDTDAVIARRPTVVCVDELAHTNVPGSRHEKRAQDVEEIRAAGIDVITTVNIQHLESLNDEVERITGVRQRETVPDDVVRTADQIQLVDMSPEALRRRMAHGNIYKPENIDASLTSYFRVGNLTALRELALLWLADRVDDALDDYRRTHQIEETWPAKERIVVAVTGGAESETLIRRGARLAQRAAGSELLAVHVIATDGLRIERRDAARPGPSSWSPALGGTFHSVVGEDVAAAVVDFATGANATMIVVGVSRHGRRPPPVHRHDRRPDRPAGRGDRRAPGHPRRGDRARPGRRRSSRRCRAAASSPAGSPRCVLPAALTWVLHLFEDTDQLPLATLSLLAQHRAGRPGRRPAPGAARRGRRLPGPQLVLHAAGRHVHRLGAEEPRGPGGLRRGRRRGRVGRGPGLAPGRSRPPRRAPRPPRSARCPARCSPARTPPRRSWSGCARPSARTPSPCWSGRRRAGACWPRPATRAPPTPGRGRHPGRGRRRPRASRCAASRCGPRDQRVLEAFAVQTGLVLEYRRLRAREERAAAARGGRGDVDRAAARGLPRPADAAGDDADRRRRAGGRRARRGRPRRAGRCRRGGRPTSSRGSSTTCSTCPGCSPGSSSPSCGRAASTRCCRSRCPATRRGRSRSRSTRRCRSCCTDSGLLERVVANLVGNAVRVSNGKPVRVLGARPPGHGRDPGRGPGPRRTARAAGADVRAVPAARRRRRPAASGSASPSPAASPRPSTRTLSAEDTPGGGLTMVLSVPRAAAG